MDAKNWEAIELGPELMLGKLANLLNATPDRESVARFKRDYGSLLRGKEARPLAVAVEEFREKYGELYPGMGVTEYLVCAKIFQHAWHAKTRADKEYVSQRITSIFEREGTEKVKGLLPPLEIKDPDDPRLRPGFVADFESGKVDIKARTLLDWLAKWLLEYRDKLAVCERKDCPAPFYVKAHPRYRYCSASCGYAMRKKGKRRWWREKRGKGSGREKESKR